MTDEPQRPAIPPAVRAWLSARPSLDLASLRALDSIPGDLPPHVAKWWTEHKAWFDAHAEWRARQPFDLDYSRDRWRMFGGPWIPWRRQLVTATTDGLMTTVVVPDMYRDLVHSGAPEERLRRIAGAIYEWREMNERASAVIADLLTREP